MSSCSSPRSTTSATLEKFERRISLENLLKEANLDRDSLLHILQENPVAIADLDKSRIEAIINQAQQQQQQTQNENPFGNNIESNDTKETNEYENENENKNESIPISHYKIIKNEFKDLRTRINKLQNKIKLESYANNIKRKTEYANRLLSLSTLSSQKKEIINRYNKTAQNYKNKKQLILENVSNIEIDINNETYEQQNLLLKKIALQQNVIKNESKLRDLLSQKKRFSEMRDISQFKPIAVFYVLKYLEIPDFICAILCCKAWYFSLNKPSYFRILTRNIIIMHRRKQKRKLEMSKTKIGDLVSSETKLKRINHAVMQLTINKLDRKKDKKDKNSSKRNLNTPRPDDIYTQCMQQLQKVIAQSEQDREEWETQVKAQMGILKFMQASMYNKMNEGSKLRVRKWELKNKNYNQYSIEKKDLHSEIKQLEINLNKNRFIISNIKQNMIQQQQIREKQLKMQIDLRSVKSGTSNIEQSNELKKLKQQMKKLSQVMVKLKQEIQKRNQDVKKYNDRVELLESQYKQYSQQPLP